MQSTRPTLFSEAKISFIGIALLGLIQLMGPKLIISAQAQTQHTSENSQSRKKVVIQSNKQVGFKDLSANKYSKGSMSLNPELFQRKSERELSTDTAGNPDYRIARGCMHRSFNEDNLPQNIGIENKQFSEFFKNQTKTFFSHMRGDCIPYAVAYGNRNRFDSLSIMNGPYFIKGRYLI